METKTPPPHTFQVELCVERISLSVCVIERHLICKTVKGIGECHCVAGIFFLIFFSLIFGKKRCKLQRWGEFNHFFQFRGPTFHWIGFDRMAMHLPSTHFNEPVCWWVGVLFTNVPTPMTCYAIRKPRQLDIWSSFYFHAM